MLDEICGRIHNYFEGECYTGTFVIEGGRLQLDGLKEGQYFRVCGSRFNDGVWQYPASDMADEVFTGAIWEMRLPKQFLALANEITAWAERYGEAATGPYQSERVEGVYSYTRGVKGGAGWEEAFARRLDRWRKLA